jgi:hypothetical protein
MAKYLAVRSRAGRCAVSDWNKFLEFLDSLPDKKFNQGEYCCGGVYCVIGAAIPELAPVLSDRLEQVQVNNYAALSRILGRPLTFDEDMEAIQDEIWGRVEAVTGLSLEDAQRVQDYNDRCFGSCGDRYDRVRKFAERKENE